jgi:hypothetical protein
MHREKGCDASWGGATEDREGERVKEDSHDEETTRLLFVEFTSHGCFHPAMDQSIARRTLQELIKREDLKNKSCVDCGNPNPQWASLRFAPFIPSTRHFPKIALSASPYLSACNARGFTEVSACTSGELIYVMVSGFLNECNLCIVLSAPYRWTLGKRIKFGEWRYGTRVFPYDPFCFLILLKIGGNAPFVAFMQSYTPVEQGGYKEGMSVHDKYHSWAAAQYREKVRSLKS